MRPLRANSWGAMIALAVLTSGSMLYLTLLPLFVDQLQQAFALSPAEAGLVTSLNAYAAVAGAIVTAPFATRLPWRRMIVIALAILALCEFVTPLAPGFPALIGLRVFHGIASGVALAISLSLLGRTELPDRAYAVLLVYQSLIAAAGLFVLPRFTAAIGPSFLFAALTAGALVGILAAIPLPDFPIKPSADTEGESRSARRWTIAGALIATYMLQAFHTFLVGHALSIGEQLGLARAIVTSGVATGVSMGVLGSILVIAIGARYGRVGPLLCVIPPVVLVGVLLLGPAASAATWFSMQIIDYFTNFFVVPILLGICAAAGDDGRSAVWGGLASMVGIATGPVAGGIVLEMTGVQILIVAACGGMVVATVIAAITASSIARRTRA